MDIFTYNVDLPDNVSEVVTPCFGGYTVYINKSLTYEERMKAFDHAMRHIRQNDFEKENVQDIEKEAHKEAV